MDRIGAHSAVITYAVGGWDSALHPASERYGATCATCGVWRADSPDTLREALSSAPCSPPFTVPIDTIPARVVAELLASVLAM